MDTTEPGDNDNDGDEGFAGDGRAVSVKVAALVTRNPQMFGA